MTVKIQEKTIAKISKVIDMQEEHKRGQRRLGELFKAKKMQLKKDKDIRRTEKYERK